MGSLLLLLFHLLSRGVDLLHNVFATYTLPYRTQPNPMIVLLPRCAGGGGGGGDDGPRWQAYVSHAVGTAAHWVVGWAWTQGASMLSVQVRAPGGGGGACRLPERRGTVRYVPRHTRHTQVSPDAREGGVDVRVRRSRDCGWGVAVHARQYCGGLMLMDCALKSYVQLSLP
jgi:hypothetical protein